MICFFDGKDGKEVYVKDILVIIYDLFQSENILKTNCNCRT